MELLQGQTANRLLASLSTDDFGRIKKCAAFVELPVRRQLEIRNRPSDYIYFFESGLSSMVVSAGTQTIEVGIVGFEGMTGLSTIHETNQASHETFMQAGGVGWRVPCEELALALSSSATLRTTLQHFAHTLMTQMAFTALANGRYRVEERLARWLLMARDRSSSDTMLLTHEFLAVMLGVRRPGVTTALSALVQRKLIDTTRGAITILDRAGLVETTNGCYGGPEREYERLFGRPIRL